MAGDGNAQGRAIFISYRRDDSEGEAGRLYDDLVRAYGDNSVFMDVAGIQPGLDFRKAIDDNVASCGVLLAIVGPSWATVTGRDGARRLDNPDDYVRLEIASALARKVPVIPVLVHDAHMPALEQLPENLKDLRYRNSVELTHARWNSDVALLIGALKSYVSDTQANQTETVHATVPVQLPAPQPAAPAEPVKKSKLPLWIGIGAAAAIVVALAIYAVMHNLSSPQPYTNTSTINSAQAAQPVAGAASTPSPAPAVSTAESAMLGKWKISEEPTGKDDLERVSVADFGGQIMVQAWGKCPDHPCNWGSRKATLNGAEAVTEAFEPRNAPVETTQQRSATLSIQPAADGLQVTVKNTYQMSDGQTKVNYHPMQFEKIP